MVPSEFSPSTSNVELTVLVADLYPSASVIGTDLSPIQPTWLPVNVRMFVEDCEEPDWLHGSGYDLVHFRGMASSVQDLDGLLAKAYPYVSGPYPLVSSRLIRGQAYRRGRMG